MEHSFTSLKGSIDVYGGFTVDSSANGILSADQLLRILPNCLQSWKEQGIIAVWMKIFLQDSQWIQVCALHGFEFHHAIRNYCMMTKWLSDKKKYSLPLYPFTTIGVGGIVENNEGKLLMIREKNGIYKGWKFPGGLVDPKENLFAAVRREVEEETGMKAEALGILCIRHAHKFQWENVSDFYFPCLMRLSDEGKIQTELRPCPTEIEECQWFSVDEISQLPNDQFGQMAQYAFNMYQKYLKDPNCLVVLDPVESAAKGSHGLFYVSARAANENENENENEKFSGP